jgi:lipid-binding SYLF domain-containing protein
MRTVLLATALSLAAAPVGAQSDEQKRIENAAQVLTEVLGIPDDVPADVLDRAECVVVLPSVVKFAFVFGGSHGKGVMTCRSGSDFTGPWSAPTMMRLTGGSFGLQIGGRATDFVLFVMNPRGAEAILKSQVKLGADVAAAAGPKGRNASAATDATMRAEILSYSRSRGLFAGVSLDGSSLRADKDSNERLYGRELEARDIVLSGAVAPPAAAARLLATLDQKSRTNKSAK